MSTPPKRKHSRFDRRARTSSSTAVALIATFAVSFGLLGFLDSVPSAIAQTNTAALTATYVADGATVELDPVPGTFAVRARDLAATSGLVADFADASLGVRARSEWLPIDVLRVTVPASELRLAIEAARADARVAWAEPVFRYGETEQIITGRILVAIPRNAPDAIAARTEVDRTSAELGASLAFDHSLDYDHDLYELSLPADRALDALDIVQIYAEIPGVLYAEPVFYWQAGFHVPNDSLFPQQWAMRNTSGNPGTPGADIEATAAWDLTRGDPSVSIAILDEGVDVDHPDLAANMVAGVDTTDSSPPGGIPGNAACGDHHGTACAGIAAGVGDNSRGVSGVAPRCSIAPVRMAYGSVWTTNTWAANAFNWVRSNGHDVASCSWGGGSPSTTLTNAINNCRQNGRGGLGCVILFASGNNDGAVSYPANLSSVIAVGASSPCDERKNPSSCDGEWWWGSNHGSQLDIVAPGVLHPTTDIGGGCGYAGGDYVTDFNGTSSACPTAAGVAGLVLSRSPNLTESDVRDLLEDTADDQVGPPSEDTPGFDIYFGHGRVNALNAVDAAGPSDPPTVSSLTPEVGPIYGNTTVTITGSAFNLGTEVLFDGVASTNVVFIDENTVTARSPSSDVLHTVDVEVRTGNGSDTLPDAYTYRPTISLLGTPSIGSTVDIAGAGPVDGNWGVVTDTELGPRFKKGIWWEIGFRNFEIVHNSWREMGGPLNGFGQGRAFWSIPDDPGLIGETFYCEAVFDGNGPGGGNLLVLADLLTVTIEP